MCDSTNTDKDLMCLHRELSRGIHCIENYNHMLATHHAVPLFADINSKAQHIITQHHADGFSVKASHIQDMMRPLFTKLDCPPFSREVQDAARQVADKLPTLISARGKTALYADYNARVQNIVDLLDRLVHSSEIRNPADPALPAYNGLPFNDDLVSALRKEVTEERVAASLKCKAIWDSTPIERLSDDTIREFTSIVAIVPAQPALQSEPQSPTDELPFCEPDTTSEQMKSVSPKKPGATKGVQAVVESDGGVASSRPELTKIEGVKLASDFVMEKYACLLYTSDAADEEDSVDLGGRRIIKKKKK
eukprot:TRINITY_DN28226_c0_g2_i1.p1 TRINITY_DN28226_c0_g2~~TRINITY_DN28226_c0_g2_i1.p1  ORF type:complete len:307 (-),score=55.59 TRINITY_DN28226_c0_g2_i1:96-1016(-)